MLFQSWSLFAFHDSLSSIQCSGLLLLFDRLNEGIMSWCLLTQALAWLPLESENVAAGSDFLGCVEREAEAQWDRTPLGVCNLVGSLLV